MLEWSLRWLDGLIELHGESWLIAAPVMVAAGAGAALRSRARRRATTLKRAREELDRLRNA